MNLPDEQFIIPINFPRDVVITVHPAWRPGDGYEISAVIRVVSVETGEEISVRSHEHRGERPTREDALRIAKILLNHEIEEQLGFHPHEKKK